MKRIQGLVVLVVVALVLATALAFASDNNVVGLGRKPAYGIGPDIPRFCISDHDYDSGDSDWTLTDFEAECMVLDVSDANASVNIIAPDWDGKMFILRNLSNQTVTLKISGGTGGSVGNGSVGMFIHNGSDYETVDADSTY